MTSSQLEENFFRHEYSRLVAMLSCRVGVEFLEEVEDAVQSALMTAIESWTRDGQPDRPSAWLYRVAKNNLLDDLRQHKRRRRILQESIASENYIESSSGNSPVDEAGDGMLKMLFVCCDESIPVESQLVLALKVLCGFDIREIAIRLFTTEANVYKRLSRARSRLRRLSMPGKLNEDLRREQYALRLPAVHKVLYLLFTEGYLSSNASSAIRQELCEEAMRLANLLAKHPAGDHPETFALLALMYLHASRSNSRQDGSGGLLLLEEQNRDLWDRRGIEEGLRWLALSATGDDFSRYHAEAGIAAEHCLAPSFQETRWDKVDACYALLERTTDSPIHKMNRAIAVAHWKGPAEGLAILDDVQPPRWLAESYLWAAVLSDLHRRCGNNVKANRYRESACKAAPTTAVRQLLRRRLTVDQAN